MVAERRGHSVDALLVKDSSAQVARRGCQRPIRAFLVAKSWRGHVVARIVEFNPRDQMILWKELGLALLVVGLPGGIKLLFDLIEKNKGPKNQREVVKHGEFARSHVTLRR